MPIGQTNFPGAVDTPSTLIEATNNAATKLTAPLSIGNTLEMLVTDTSLFPATSVITVESERIAYSGKTPTSFTGLIRAFGGTVDAFHAANADVKLLIIAEMHNAHTEAIIAVEEYVLAGGADVIPGGVDTEIQVNAAGALGAVSGFNIADGLLRIPADVTFPVKESLSGEWLEDTEFESEGQWVLTDGWTWGGDGTVSFTEPTTGGVAAVAVTDGGSGYLPYNSQGLTFTGAGNEDAHAYVEKILAPVAIVSGGYVGTGYVVGDVVTLVGGDNNATVEITALGGGSGIASVIVITPGTNYPQSGSFPVSGGSGSGGTVYVSVDTVAGGGPIYTMAPPNPPGSGYALLDVITPTDSGDGAGSILEVSALIQPPNARQLSQPGVLIANRYYTVTVHATGTGHLMVFLDGGDWEVFDVATSGGILTLTGLWEEYAGVRLLIQAQPDFVGMVTSASVTGYLTVPRLLQVATSEVLDGTGLSLIGGRGINGLGGKGETAGGLAWGESGYSGDLLGGPGVVAGGKAGDTDGLVFGASVHSLGASYRGGIWSGGELWLRGGMADTASRRDRFEGLVAPNVNGGNIRLTPGPAHGGGTPGVIIAESPLIVPDHPYDSSWSGDLSVPTKDALRSKLESLSPAGGEWAVQFMYGGAFTGTSSFTFNYDKLFLDSASIEVGTSYYDTAILRAVQYGTTELLNISAQPYGGLGATITLGATGALSQITTLGQLQISGSASSDYLKPLWVEPALTITTSSGRAALDLSTYILHVQPTYITLDASVADGPHATWFNTRIAPTTISHAAATATITDAATLRIDGPTIAGIGVTLTNSWSLWVAGGPSRFDGLVVVTDLPAADPGIPGALYQSSGVVMISL